jgi:hydroxymethylpyrimidine/phosphomethylpyrimidine kinase
MTDRLNHEKNLQPNQEENLRGDKKNRGRPPIVLVASGFDPTGSAGIIADIRVLTLLGCHPCGVITCNTVQSSKGLTGIRATEPDILREQLDHLLGDLQFDAVKIGALASVESIEVLASSLKKIPQVPVVLDPVFEPSEGPPFLDMECMQAMSGELLPQTLIATPNCSELGYPAGLEVQNDDDDMIAGCASGWFDTGVETVLVTGLRREGMMVDRLMRIAANMSLKTVDITHAWHDVGKVHGTGCILSGAIAGYIASGEKLESAVRRAVGFTSGLIEQAVKLGAGMSFWLDSDGKSETE